MDGERFDSLTRALVTPRRGALRTLLAGALAGTTRPGRARRGRRRLQQVGRPCERNADYRPGAEGVCASGESQCKARFGQCGGRCYNCGRDPLRRLRHIVRRPRRRAARRVRRRGDRRRPLRLMQHRVQRRRAAAPAFPTWSQTRTTAGRAASARPRSPRRCHDPALLRRWGVRRGLPVEPGPLRRLRQRLRRLRDGSGGCVNRLEDESHCGACGVACAASQRGAAAGKCRG